MKRPAEISNRKVIFFAASAFSPIVSKDQNLPVTDLIYHGLVQNNEQEVFWNPKFEPVEDNICVVALGDAIHEVKKYLDAVYKSNPQRKLQVLFLGEFYHDISSFNGSNITFETIFTSEDLNLSFLDKPQNKNSSFLDATTILVNLEQMYVFQRVIHFLEINKFVFRKMDDKTLCWYLTAPFKNLKGEIVPRNLDQSGGFAYEESKTSIPFVFKYDKDLAATDYPIKPTVNTISFFPSTATVKKLGAIVAVASLVSIAILCSWEMTLIATAIMAAFAMIAYSVQLARGESTRAPHSLSN